MREHVFDLAIAMVRLDATARRVARSPHGPERSDAVAALIAATTEFRHAVVAAELEEADVVSARRMANELADALANETGRSVP